MLVGVSLYDHGRGSSAVELEAVVTQQYKPAVATYVQVLKDKDNVVVNRAAVALGELGNREAVGPLIDALVTTHTFKVQKGQPGQTPLPLAMVRESAAAAGSPLAAAARRSSSAV